MKPSVLIIDDNLDTLKMLKAILTSAGHVCRTSLNSRYALETARSQPPDLILLDVLMPDISGYDICKQLKADIVTKEIPVIFVSAQPAATNKIQAQKVGGSAYISKPFRVGDLLDSVNRFLASG